MHEVICEDHPMLTRLITATKRRNDHTNQHGYCATANRYWKYGTRPNPVSVKNGYEEQQRGQKGNQRQLEQKSL